MLWILLFLIFIIIFIWMFYNKESTTKQENNKEETKKPQVSKKMLKHEKSQRCLWNNYNQLEMIECQNNMWNIDSSGQIFINKNCLEAGNFEGDWVSLKKCDDSDKQKWELRDKSIISKFNQLCLEVIPDKNRIRMWNCDNDLKSQIWII
jgi:hypothetical protein